MAQADSLQRQVETNLRWNFVVNLLDITFIMFGLNLVSQSTIMPLLVSELTPSRVAIGLIPAVYSLGYLLPQLLTANFAESLPLKKPFVMLLGGLGERVPYLLIGLVVCCGQPEYYTGSRLEMLNSLIHHYGMLRTLPIECGAGLEHLRCLLIPADIIKIYYSTCW